MRQDAAGTLAVAYTVNSYFDNTNSYDSNPGDGICEDAQAGSRCTIRAALMEANATAGTGLVEIEFALPFVINVSNTPLPAVTRDNVDVSACATPGGTCGNLMTGYLHDIAVVIDGSNFSAGGTQDGLQINADNVTVEGLNLRHFPDRGIEIHGDDNTLQHCYVGTNVDGNAAAGNGREGVYISGADNFVFDNLISGNLQEGVLIAGAAATGNIVRRNLIGTDETGTLDLGNTFDGVEISGGASGNLIGITGSVPDALENVISGNNSDGVELLDADDNGVYGNFIGLDIEGGARGNSAIGVYIGAGASGNEIGANEHVNQIGSNALDGVLLTGSGTSNNRVVGNHIGTYWAGPGLYVRSNGRHGVYLRGGASSNTIGDGDISGLSNSSYANMILSNTSHGLVVEGDATSGNILQSNFLDDNGGFGILIDGAPGNTVGSDASGQVNQIADNGDDGIRVQGADAVGNMLYYNNIGFIDLNGGDHGNGSSGIDVRNGATGTIIGTASSRTTNIMGNDHNGIAIGSNAGGTTVRNCVIGIDDFDDDVAANNGPGIIIDATSSGNTIDGSVVSGNDGVGVLLQGTDNVLTDNYIGTTQSGDVARPNGTAGIQLEGNNNTVGATALAGDPGPGNGGNVIAGNAGVGLLITGDGNGVYGNYVGVSAAGTSLGNGSGGKGIQVEGADNTIGYAAFTGSGLESGRNVVSGNSFDGVRIVGAGATGNVVQANYIGLAPDGDTVLPGQTVGVRLGGGASGNTVGSSFGTNVISGNSRDGIAIGDSDGNLVIGNLIGTNAAGDADRGNGGWGVLLFAGSTGNSIGSTAAFGRNTISGNNGPGIFIDGADGNTIVNNQIGTDAGGSLAIPNSAEGVRLVNGSSGNRIGGTGSDEANVIAFNSGDGIYDANAIAPPNNTGLNNIRRNSIHSNGGLGIDVGSDGQHAPPITITSVSYSGSNRIVSYEIDGASTATIFTVELYHDAAGDPSGYGEGKSFLASEVIATDGSGGVSDQFFIPIDDLPGGYATLTLVQNNQTTEFSSAFEVPVVKLSTSVLLEGPYSTGSASMETDLRLVSGFPLGQPYSDARYDSSPLSYDGLESVDAPPGDMVDWVLLDLRSSTDPTTREAQRAALVLADGSVVDTDGVSPVAFSVPTGHYFVVVRHRNHLPAMSTTAVDCTGGTCSYDFTTGQGQAYGSGALADLGDGAFGLIAGDGNFSGGITASDQSVWSSENGLSGYLAGDYNLTGGNTASDQSKWLQNNGTSSQVPEN